MPRVLVRVLSVVLGIYGIIVVALITSIIINFYSETKDVRMTDEDPDHEKPDDSEKPAPDIPAGSQNLTDTTENEE